MRLRGNGAASQARALCRTVVYTVNCIIKTREPEGARGSQREPECELQRAIGSQREPGQNI